MAVLDLANNYTIEVKFCTYNVVSVIINLDANLFYLFIILFIFYILICDPFWENLPIRTDNFFSDLPL